MDPAYSYHTIQINSEGLFKDKSSKFYSYAFPLHQIEEIKEYLEQIKALHPKAKHHCYAYRWGIHHEVEKASDAGEPNGSAGLPILNQIKSKNITNCLIIVVRYFGGTKLGIPGLIHAYKEATKAALEVNEIIEKEIKIRLKMVTSYENANQVYPLIQSVNGIIIHQFFEREAIFEIEIPLKMKNILLRKIAENQFISLKE